MKKIELDIVALSHSVTQSHNYAVVLGEQDGSRRLPIVIGGFEAQAIAVAMERMTPNRPLTHDLFKNTLETFEVELKEVIINNLLDGIFYARLICLKDGEEFEIDSRTSDALAMAVRFNCPIFTYEFILSSAGIILDEEDSENPTDEAGLPKEIETATPIEISDSPSESKMSIEELEQELQQAIEAEDYERASQLRDIINSRNSN